MCPLTVTPQPDLTACEQWALSSPASAPSRWRLAVPSTVPPGDGARLMDWPPLTGGSAHCPRVPMLLLLCLPVAVPSALGACGALASFLRQPARPWGEAPVSLCTPGPGSAHGGKMRRPPVWGRTERRRPVAVIRQHLAVRGGGPFTLLSRGSQLWALPFAPGHVGGAPISSTSAYWCCIPATCWSLGCAFSASCVTA